MGIVIILRFANATHISAILNKSTWASWPLVLRYLQVIIFMTVHTCTNFYAKTFYIQPCSYASPHRMYLVWTNEVYQPYSHSTEELTKDTGVIRSLPIDKEQWKKRKTDARPAQSVYRLVNEANEKQRKPETLGIDQLLDVSSKR